MNLNERFELKLKSDSLDDLVDKLKERGLNTSIQSILVEHIARNFSEKELQTLEDELNKLFLW